MLTLGDMRSYLAPYVDGGVCADSPRIPLVLDEVIERLVNKPDIAGRYTVRMVRLGMYGNDITLPRDIRKIIKFRIEGVRASAYTRWFEFMDGGPGDFSDSCLTAQDLVDRGEHCTQYDMPTTVDDEEWTSGFRLMVLSDSAEDPSATLSIRGITPDGREVITEGKFGEPILIRETVGVYSQATYAAITTIKKPLTNGYVFLYAYDPDTGKAFFLSSFRPDETNPLYRRYRTQGWNYDEDGEAVYRSVMALVQMRPVPLRADEDIPLIQNRAALKTMIQAVNYYNAGDPKTAVAYEGTAERILGDDTSSFVGDANEGIDLQVQGNRATWMF